MGRIKCLTSRVERLPSRMTALSPPEQVRYGKGRGGRPWRRLVEAVKVRDALTCQKCYRVTEDGECDHVVPESEGGQTTLANLQWLCRKPCHEEKTKAEAARGAMRLQRRT